MQLEGVPSSTDDSTLIKQIKGAETLEDLNNLGYYPVDGLGLEDPEDILGVCEDIQEAFTQALERVLIQSGSSL